MADIQRTDAGFRLAAMALSCMPRGLCAWIQRSDARRRFLKLAGWSVVAFALDKAALMTVVLLLARILGASDYGRLTLAQGMVNATQIFVVLGAGALLARFIPAMRVESTRRAVEVVNLCFLVVLGTAAVVAICGVAYSTKIATRVLGVSAGSPIPYFMVVWVLHVALNGLFTTVMLSFEKGRTMGVVSMVGAAMASAVVPTMAIQNGLLGAIGALAAVEIVKTFLLLVAYKRLLAAEGVPILTPINRADLPLLWQFGLPLFLTSALWAPTVWLAQFIVKILAPDGLINVGVIGFATTIMGAVMLLSSLTNQAAMPILSSLAAQGRYAESKIASFKLGLVQAAGASLIGAPLIVAMPWIMAFANPEFEPYILAAVIIIVVGILTASMTAFGNYLVLRGRTVFIMGTMFFWSVAFISGTALLSHHGAVGYAVSIFVATCLRFLLIVAVFVREGADTTARWHLQSNGHSHK